MKKKKFSGSAPMPAKTGKPTVSSGKPAPTVSASPSTSGSTSSSLSTSGGGTMKKGGMVKSKKC